MIPAFADLPGSPWPVLPPGIYQVTLGEMRERYAYNPKRRTQFAGLLSALRNLRRAGCREVLIDGSYVTAKPQPGDYDACWQPDRVNPQDLDPVFFDFDNNRANQKAKFLGEFFPATARADALGATFLDFFQTDKFTGARKGIISIAPTVDPMLTLEQSS